MARKLKIAKHRANSLDDLTKWRIEQLAKNGGFAARAIAKQVFGKGGDREVHKVRYHLHTEQIRLLDWRNIESVLARSHAASVQKAKAASKRRRAVA